MKSFVPINSPNLPSSTVKHAVVSGQYPQLITALEDLGVSVLQTQSSPDVMSQISYHTDILFSHLGKNQFLIEHNQLLLIEELKKIGFVQLDDSVKLADNYPSDVLLNCCILNNRIICGRADVHPLLTKNRNIIRTSQGYAKCSVCVVDENSVITDDLSIFDACNKNEIDALLVSKGSVMLDGFEYGFIGGCSGKLSKDSIAFCGDIRTHTDYDKIKSFISYRGIETVNLSSGQLIDIGSIIPLTQYSTSALL